jgi:hypothetical protein
MCDKEKRKNEVSKALSILAALNAFYKREFDRPRLFFKREAPP